MKRLIEWARYRRGRGPLSQEEAMSELVGAECKILLLNRKIESLLAACKAKDEALRDIIAVDDQEWSESHKAVVMRDRAKLALQPDSSVKPEQETFRRSEAGNQ